MILALILDDVRLFFCVISFSPCRFYGELTKTVNLAEELLPPRVQKQMRFLNESLIRAVSFFGVCLFPWKQENDRAHRGSASQH